MDAEYKDIFESLYEARPDLRYPTLQYRYFTLRQDPLGEDGVAVRQAIDYADAELFTSRRRRIRSDAKYFLFVNFMEMLFLPMRIRGEGLTDDLRSYIRADLDLLVNDAARRQGEREPTPGTSGQAVIEPELSGHSVLESVALNWKNLKLSDLRIWGED